MTIGIATLLIIFSLISALFSFGYAQTMYILPMHMASLFGNNGAKLYGISTSVNAILVVVSTALILNLTKKNSPLFNITIAGIFFAIGFGMLYFANSFMIFILSTIIWTIGEILHATNVGVYIANNSPKSHRARFNSLYGIISGSGQAMGPVIVGKYLLNNPIKNVWVITFFIALGCGIIMYVFNVYENRKYKKIKIE